MGRVVLRRERELLLGVRMVVRVGMLVRSRLRSAAVGGRRLSLLLRLLRVMKIVVVIHFCDFNGEKLH